MNGEDNIYWLFSSAAQSIAAFVALLIAGYTLVLTMMDAAARADETLVEVHDELKRQYHKMLSLLSSLTASAIIGSFVVIFLNKFKYN